MENRFVFLGKIISRKNEKDQRYAGLFLFSVCGLTYFKVNPPRPMSLPSQYTSMRCLPGL